jgi:glycosyltransferase involved in cell wall biosynthesis
LLDEECERVGVPLDRPSDWMVERERREYERADRIMVLSSFSQKTFLDEGVPAERLMCLPLGANLSAFRGTAALLSARAHRIRSGEPLTVLYVGALSFRKGFRDLVEVAAALDRTRFRLVLIGNVLPEVKSLVTALPPHVVVEGRVPQDHLPEVYASGDVFLFPTIEDGFPVVLAQAHAAGLPIITTPNGAGTDIVRSEADGWIVPIRQPAAILDRLTWCDGNRDALARMIEGRSETAASRTWGDVAADFERLCDEALATEPQPELTSC